MSFEDETLVQLVKEAEEKGIGIGLTLCVNGLIITGTVIRSKAYFDKLIPKHDESAFSTKDPSEIELARSYFAKLSTPVMRESSEEQDDNPKYIHLDNVVMYPSSPDHPFVAGLWRGKLSNIDGFSLGIAYWKTRTLDEDDEDEQA
jgi:hypothetical protein